MSSRRVATAESLSNISTSTSKNIHHGLEKSTRPSVGRQVDDDDDDWEEAPLTVDESVTSITEPSTTRVNSSDARVVKYNNDKAPFVATTTSLATATTVTTSSSVKPRSRSRPATDKSSTSKRRQPQRRLVAISPAGVVMPTSPTTNRLTKQRPLLPFGSTTQPSAVYSSQPQQLIGCPQLMTSSSVAGLLPPPPQSSSYLGASAGGGNLLFHHSTSPASLYSGGNLLLPSSSTTTPSYLSVPPPSPISSGTSSVDLAARGNNTDYLFADPAPFYHHANYTLIAGGPASGLSSFQQPTPLFNPGFDATAAYYQPAPILLSSSSSQPILPSSTLAPPPPPFILPPLASPTTIGATTETFLPTCLASVGNVNNNNASVVSNSPATALPNLTPAPSTLTESAASNMPPPILHPSPVASLGKVHSSKFNSVAGRQPSSLSSSNQQRHQLAPPTSTTSTDSFKVISSSTRIAPTTSADSSSVTSSPPPKLTDSKVISSSTPPPKSADFSKIISLPSSNRLKARSIGIMAPNSNQLIASYHQRRRPPPNASPQVVPQEHLHPTSDKDGQEFIYPPPHPQTDQSAASLPAEAEQQQHLTYNNSATTTCQFNVELSSVCDNAASAAESIPIQSSELDVEQEPKELDAGNKTHLVAMQEMSVATTNDSSPLTTTDKVDDPLLHVDGDSKSDHGDALLDDQHQVDKSSAAVKDRHWSDQLVRSTISISIATTTPASISMTTTTSASLAITSSSSSQFSTINDLTISNSSITSCCHQAKDVRTLLTHFIDGHVIYESNKPFPVRNALALVQLLLVEQKESRQNGKQPLVEDDRLDNSLPSTTTKTKPTSAEAGVKDDGQDHEIQKKKLASISHRRRSGHQSRGVKKLKRRSTGRVGRGAKRRRRNSRSSPSSSNADARGHTVVESPPRSLDPPPPLDQCTTIDSPHEPPHVPKNFDSSLSTTLVADQSKPFLASLTTTTTTTTTTSSHSSINTTTVSKTSPLTILSTNQQQAGQSMPGVVNGGNIRTNSPHQHHPTSVIPPIPPPDGPVDQWTALDVVQFVSTTPGCQAYAERFLANEIDGEALLLLAHDASQFIKPPIGMKIGPALKLAARLGSLK